MYIRVAAIDRIDLSKATNFTTSQKTFANGDQSIDLPSISMAINGLIATVFAINLDIIGNYSKCTTSGNADV